jgi:hypothetical protein
MDFFWVRRSFMIFSLDLDKMVSDGLDCFSSDLDSNRCLYLVTTRDLNVTAGRKEKTAKISQRFFKERIFQVLH